MKKFKLALIKAILFATVLIFVVEMFGCDGGLYDEYTRAKDMRIGMKFNLQHKKNFSSQQNSDTVTYRFPYYGSSVFVSFRISDSVIIKVWETKEAIL